MFSVGLDIVLFSFSCSCGMWQSTNVTLMCFLNGSCWKEIFLSLLFALMTCLSQSHAHFLTRSFVFLLLVCRVHILDASFLSHVLSSPSVGKRVWISECAVGGVKVFSWWALLLMEYSRLVVIFCEHFNDIMSRRCRWWHYQLQHPETHTIFAKGVQSVCTRIRERGMHGFTPPTQVYHCVLLSCDPDSSGKTSLPLS